MTLSDYLLTLKSKKVTVLGIGVSNRPLIELLCASGAQVTARDKKPEEALGEVAEKLRSRGVTLKLGAEYLENIDADVIFRTPGMRPDIPELVAAHENGSVITSEMEVFFEVCPCPIIAVTGSDGKTTTTSIIYEMLTKAGYTCHLGGNIGHPLLADTQSIMPNDYAVVELSSFQLMTMKKSPHIAVITNISPNHLDVHHGMKEYIDAKKNIFIYQTKTDRVVFNADNEITASFIGESNANTFVFSQKTAQNNSIYCTDGEIRACMNNVLTDIMPEKEILLPGKHNLENYMAAIAATWAVVSVKDVISVAKTFKGVEHRTEFVRELDGVRYYNDSIATSPTRVIAGLHSFGRVILIAGGYDKKIPFDVLGPEIIKHVKTLILCGATADKIRECVTNLPEYDKNKLPIYEFTDFTEAVKAARKAAVRGDIVTLSPACAAFDQFENFAKRGEFYKSIVENFR